VVVLLVVLAMVLVLVLVSVVLVVQAMNHPHTNHQAVVSLVVLLVVMVHRTVLVPVLPLVQAVMNHHHSQAVEDMVLMLVWPSVEVSVDQAINRQAAKFNNMLLMLKVSFKMQIHKSFVAQHPVVFKLIHKISKFAFFNHHPFHHQAYVISLFLFISIFKSNFVLFL
jgi:hypothetical protein